MWHDAEELLATAGWHRARRTDADAVIGALEGAGYDVGPNQRALIENVDGIIISYDRQGRPDAIEFDPSRALAASFRSWVEDYSIRVDTPLVPIGFSNAEHLLLLASDAGSWFGGYDNQFGLLGGSVVELVDTIANDRGFLEEL